jgi:hypothetical protein
MEPILASFSITDAQDNFGRGTLHHAYLTTATGLMPGATVLAAAPPESAWAFALIAGQILECSLKAFLSKDGVPEKVLQSSFRHDLSALWVEAINRRLPIGAMPQWAETLHSLHSGPHFHVRYPETLNALVFPDPRLTESELRNLVHTVRKALE